MLGTVLSVLHGRAHEIYINFLKSSDTLIAMNTASAQNVSSKHYTLHWKRSGLLREMADSMAKARKVRDEPLTSYCARKE